MKNLYQVTDQRGIHLCYQTASSETQAVEFAVMYGHKRAAVATFIRKEL